jgi:anti-sigma regulatory factor (Ser/Thr protein kinase)
MADEGPAGERGDTPAAAQLLLEVGSDTAAFAAAQEALHEHLEAAGVGERAIFRTELAFEELVTNVVRHGYGGRRSNLTPVEVTASVLDEEIVLSIEDPGPPFDPSQPVDAAARPTSIEDATIGGLGLRLVHAVASRIEYHRRDGRNRVTVGIARY